MGIPNTRMTPTIKIANPITTSWPLDGLCGAVVRFELDTGTFSSFIDEHTRGTVLKVQYYV